MLKTDFFLRRPLTACALGLAGGIALGIGLAWKPWLPAAGLALCILWILLKGNRRENTLAAVTGCLLFFGFLYGGWQAHPAVPAVRGTVTVTAVIADDLVPRAAGGWRSVLRDAVFTDQDGNVKSLGRLYWTMNPDESRESQMVFASSVRPGDRVTVTGRIYEPSPRMNPYGFDFRLYCLQQGMRLGFSGCSDGVILERNVFSFEGAAGNLRRALSSALDRVFGPSAVYPRALLLGEREALADETRESFTKLGIAHILAVSGLHVALLAGFLSGLAKLCGAGVRTRFALSAVFLLLYCAVLGFPVSALRASILFILEQGRHVFRRSRDTLTSLSAALIVILLLFPLSILSVSLWMTFGAVLGIHLIHISLDWRLRACRFAALIMPVLTTLGATMGMVLPSVMAYHSFSLWGLILSPAACAFLALLMPLYLIIFAVGLLCLPLGQAMAGALARLLGWLPVVMKGLPGLTLNLPAPSVLFIIAFVTLVFLATRYVVLSPRRRIMIGAAVAALCAAAGLFAMDGPVRYVQLSMGQADAALIEDGRKTVVIDTGENGSDLVSYLLSRGRRADTLVLTHLHTDHCGGVRQMIDAGLEPGEVILPEGAEKQQVDPAAADILALFDALGIPVRHLARGDTLSTPRVQMTVLWPEHGMVRPGQDANRYCLTMLADIQGTTMLLPGDLDGMYEMAAAVPADILKVAHHGSGASTSAAFLDKVSPGLLLLTCESGRALPNINTLKLLDAYGAPVCRTDLDGAVTIRFDKGGYTVTPYLK